MNTPKHWILLFIFTVLRLKKSLLIRIMVIKLKLIERGVASTLALNLCLKVRTESQSLRELSKVIECPQSRFGCRKRDVQELRATGRTTAYITRFHKLALYACAKRRISVMYRLSKA